MIQEERNSRIEYEIVYITMEETSEDTKEELFVNGTKLVVRKQIIYNVDEYENAALIGIISGISIIPSVISLIGIGCDLELRYSVLRTKRR